MRDWNALGYALLPERGRGHPETWVESQAIWGQRVDPADRFLRFKALQWIIEDHLRNEAGGWGTPEAGEVLVLRVLLDDLGRREGWEDPGDHTRGFLAAHLRHRGDPDTGTAAVEAARDRFLAEGRAWAAAGGITLGTLLAVFD